MPALDVMCNATIPRGPEKPREVGAGFAAAVGFGVFIMEQTCAAVETAASSASGNPVILPRMNIAVDTVAILRRARSVLSTEAAAISAVESRLAANGDAMVAAVQAILIATGPGRVVVTGIGKSGHVGRKIAATLASTGTPAFFVHPAEASHGDMGMIAAVDVVIALSNSGEVAEVNALLSPIKRVGAKIIAITGNEQSTLGTEADITLDAGVSEEACPLGLAPTASTAAAMALGDALAMALLEARGFTAEDFARSHPGGTLGRKLLTHVRDVMRINSAIPTVTPDATVAQALFEITGKGMGMTAVVNADGTLGGMFTDGDLRRCLPKVTDFNAARVADFMTRTPVTIGPNEMAVEAVSLLETQRKTQLLVVDVNGQLVGALHMHDLLRAKVV